MDAAERLTSISSALAVMAIQEHLAKGRVIEIPSLDMVIGSDEAVARHEAQRNEETARGHADMCARLVWPWR